MIVLRIQVNDEPAVVGGASDLGVLVANVTAVGKLGSDAQPAHPDRPPDMHLSLGGLTARGAHVPDVHVRWIGHHALAVGDRVSIEVLDAAVADPIESGHAAEQRENDEREYFEHCKRTYLQLKAKYEPGA
jgi:hypothetical protein